MRMLDPVLCPQCRRPNAAHRVACLYCGGAMPDPAPAPERSSERALPSNLDALVREALAGGNITKLRSALDQPVESAVPQRAQLPAVSGGHALSARAPRVGRAGRADGHTPRSRISPPRGPITGPQRGPTTGPQRLSTATPLRVPSALRPVPTPNVPDALQAIVDAARMAVSVHQRQGDLGQALDQVATAVERARSLAPTARLARPAEVASTTAPPAPKPALTASLGLPAATPPSDGSSEATALPGRPPVVLPRYQHRWMLILAGPGNADLGPSLAQALGVDGVTARLAAVARAPRVALRSDEPETLRAAAARVQRLGISAVVVCRDELGEIASPDVVLGVERPGRLSVSASTPWDGERPLVPPADLRSLPWAGLSLAVPGDVVVRRYRVGRSLARGRRKERVLRLGSERRVRVLDLHGPGRFVRVVAGLTDTSALPGHDAGSALRAFNGLVEGIPKILGKCAVEGERTCSPGTAPPIPDGYDGSSPIEISGWSTWEEHSRLARLLSGLGCRDVGSERA